MSEGEEFQEQLHKSQFLDDEVEEDEVEEDEEEDVEEGDDEPSLGRYLARFGLDAAAQVTLCRAYASYLVAQGKSGRVRPGPAPTLKRERAWLPKDEWIAKKRAEEAAAEPATPRKKIKKPSY